MNPFDSPARDNSELVNFSNKISENSYYLQDLVFKEGTIQNLRILAEELRGSGQFVPAKIGRANDLQRRQSIRGDELSWIEKWNTPELIELNDLFQSLVDKSKYELFQSTKRFESHFSHYPAGAAYDRHMDCHSGERHRILTAILYIGTWRKGDGGELYLYPDNTNPVKIDPLPGRLIVFKSELEHEVKRTAIDRWSIAAWIRND